MLWRYEFGQSFRPTEPYRMVEQRSEVQVAAPPAEPIVVRNEVRMDDETFFGLDSAVLNEAERSALDELVATIRSEKRVSRVSVIGHTCDLGAEAYNLKLSERRATAVRDYLVAQGVDAAEIDVTGAGEANPKYPNDGEENRRKNRRVDVEFHSAVGECAHNIILLHTLRSCYRLLSDGVLRNRLLVFSLPNAREALLEQHLAIHTAVSRGDPDAARHWAWTTDSPCPAIRLLTTARPAACATPAACAAPASRPPACPTRPATADPPADRSGLTIMFPLL